MLDASAAPPAVAQAVAKASAATARILVATDNIDDANQIVRQLRTVFENVRASTVAESAAADFDALQPDVLVLAFDSLEKSERYYLGLYRLSSGAIQGDHRTVVLCGKDEVRAAFDLCLKDHFDDYVLYWPQSYDGSRLAMSIWIACRQMVAAKGAAPGKAELLLHARHLADIERVVADPAESTSHELRQRIEPALAGTRALAETARQLKPLVLVIEDDEFSRRLVQAALDPARWEVAVASDGASALGLLRRVRPDVILMDVRLPGMDGIALTRRLKASSRMADIPVLMMTGDSTRETLVSSVEAGAEGFIVKPILRAMLEAKLAQFIPR